MTEEHGVERVEQHGEAFLVTGGKQGGGRTQFWITAQTIAEARKEGGEKRVQEILRNGVETSWQSDREPPQR